MDFQHDRISAGTAVLRSGFNGMGQEVDQKKTGLSL